VVWKPPFVNKVASATVIIVKILFIADPGSSVGTFPMMASDPTSFEYG
jgi:hypothetical protein